MRRLAVLLLLSSIVGCGSSTTPDSAPAPAPSPTFDLLAWEYPGARPIARIDPVLVGTDKIGREEIAGEPREGTRIKAPAIYAYDTSDPLEFVYAFYGRKLDLDPEYKPAELGFREDHWDSGSKFSYDKRDAYPTLRLAYTGLEGRQDVVRTATLVGPGGSGFSVVVILSRAKAEGFTTIELVVTRGQ
jgi:hypothetical protein